MSQCDLAFDADISTKHLSFLETGRSRPSRGMVLRLAGCMDVPLRDRNALLQAAGYDPVFRERRFNEPAFDLVRSDVEAVLSANDPNPAMAVDRHWIILTANRSAGRLIAGSDQSLLRPPVNLLRLCLHPAGLASRIVNLGEYRAHLIARLRRQIDVSGDGVLMDLLEEVRDYPAPRHATRVPDGVDPDLIAMPLRLATIDGVLSFLGTTTQFGTPVDITLSEMSIEAFLPADVRTAQVIRERAEREMTPERGELRVA